MPAHRIDVHCCRIKNNQIADAKREYENLRVAHNNMLDTNTQLTADLESCEKHIDLLSAMQRDVPDDNVLTYR
jgi:hypothetical protein